MDSDQQTLNAQSDNGAIDSNRLRASDASNALVVSRDIDAAQRLASMSAIPSPEAGGALSPLHSLRRRWPQILCAGTLCGVLLSAGAWSFFQPKFRTYATLRIHSETPRLAFEVNEADQAAQFDVYKRTQKELVMGDEVLLAALRNPSLSESTQIRLIAESQDPVIWLRQQLRVEFPGDAEIMTISMIGDHPKFIANAVNAVLDAYVENVIDAGKQNRNEKLAELRKVFNTQEEKARRLRSKLESLTETLGSGDADALSVKQQVAIERFAQLQTEYARVQFQRLGADLQLARVADQIKAQAEEATVEKAAAAQSASKAAPAEPNSANGKPSATTDLATLPPPVGLEAEVQRDTLVAAQREIVRQTEMALAEVKRRVGDGQTEVISRYTTEIEQERKKLTDLENVVRTALTEQHHQSALLALQQEKHQARQALVKSHEDLKSQVQTLQLHEKMLAESLAKATEEADKIGTSSVNVELTRKELERLEKINDSIGVQTETLTIELSSASRVEALGRAREPQAASKEERIKKAVAFGVLGFLLPSAGLLWLDLRRKHVNNESDVQQVSALRLLGSVPMLPRVGFYPQRRERVAFALREAIDRIRTVLLREAELSDYRVILITSAVSGEAKTSFASQLARSLARAHRRTVLIDFDLRCPSIHEAFGLPMEKGTCELLRGEISVDEVLRASDEDNLWLVMAGHCDRLALAGLTKEYLEDLISRLREAFEFVVIDSSPVLPVVDTLLVAQRADATILTALRDVSRAPQLAEAQDRLREVGANVVGSVVTTKGHHSYYDSLSRYAAHQA